MGFYKLNGIRLRAGPKKLQGSDNAKLVKTREILWISKLNMR